MHLRAADEIGRIIGVIRDMKVNVETQETANTSNHESMMTWSAELRAIYGRQPGQPVLRGRLRPQEHARDGKNTSLFHAAFAETVSKYSLQVASDDIDEFYAPLSIGHPTGAQRSAVVADGPVRAMMGGNDGDVVRLARRNAAAVATIWEFAPKRYPEISDILRYPEISDILRYPEIS
jgi:hypothetical protein